jgi:hypothetical protein
VKLLVDANLSPVVAARLRVVVTTPSTSENLACSIPTTRRSWSWPSPNTV